MPRKPQVMKRVILAVILTLIVLLGIEALACITYIHSGSYNISTFNHDTRFINRALDTGMTRSVAQHSRGIQVPALDNPEKVKEGYQDYREMCVQCHGAPGVAPEEIGKGLWPHAPNLAKTVPTWSPAELFWITKNGIKFSAMPAWGPSHSDDEIWNMVAFMETLPRLSPGDYKQLEQQTNNTAEDHHHESDHHEHGTP